MNPISNEQLHDEIVLLKQAIEELRVPVQEMQDWISAGKVGTKIVKWALSLLAAVGTVVAAWHGIKPPQ